MGKISNYRNETDPKEKYFELAFLMNKHYTNALF